MPLAASVHFTKVKCEEATSDNCHCQDLDCHVGGQLTIEELIHQSDEIACKDGSGNKQGQISEPITNSRCGANLFRLQASSNSQCHKGVQGKRHQNNGQIQAYRLF